ncbi:MAG TPA: hypothetical protein VMW55_07190 [Nitrosopumilaceae archaeon]|jgi:hypothetical protein|nr:hypothetical protein [Nitrosopumilaceae archaeon]
MKKRIECIERNSGLISMNKHSGFAACLDPYTADKLIQRGWGL